MKRDEAWHHGLRIFHVFLPQMRGPESWFASMIPALMGASFSSKSDMKPNAKILEALSRPKGVIDGTEVGCKPRSHSLRFCTIVVEWFATEALARNEPNALSGNQTNSSDISLMDAWPISRGSTVLRLTCDLNLSLRTLLKCSPLAPTRTLSKLNGSPS